MKLYKFDIPKSKLCSIPKKERVFFVQLMNFANDINALQKMMFFSAETDTDNDIVESAQNAQTLLLVKTLAVKLWEGWKLLKREFLETGDNLPQEFQHGCEELTVAGLESFKLGVESFNELAEYLKPENNIIRLIRNRFGAHYSKESSKKIGQLIEDASKSEIYPVFLSEAHGNCFYQMSHGLSNKSMLELICESQSLDAGDKPMRILLRDVVRVTGLFLDFIGSYIMVVVTKRFGFEYTEVEIPEPPDINEVTLPFFIKDKANLKAGDIMNKKQKICMWAGIEAIIIGFLVTVGPLRDPRALGVVITKFVSWVFVVAVITSGLFVTFKNKHDE